VSAALAEDPSDWRSRIYLEAPQLLTCGVPKHLSSRVLEVLPAGYFAHSKMVGAHVTYDGCSVEVLLSEDGKSVILNVIGGLNGHIRYFVGPLRSDGSDL
jgi:hypothetical protein